jgi:ribonucleoside-diphosphate reductase alpha chain
MSRVQESYQWITLVTRLASAVFRQQALQPKYNTFVVQEFLATFDPGKQYWSTHYKGRFMNSVVQEIGMLMQDHLAGLGLMDPVKRKDQPDPSPPDMPERLPEASERAEGLIPDNEEEIIVKPPLGSTQEDSEYLEREATGVAEAARYGLACPDCHGYNLHNAEGCLTCSDCGWSKCE